MIYLILPFLHLLLRSRYSISVSRLVVVLFGMLITFCWSTLLQSSDIFIFYLVFWLIVAPYFILGVFKYINNSEFIHITFFITIFLMITILFLNINGMHSVGNMIKSFTLLPGMARNTVEYSAGLIGSSLPIDFYFNRNVLFFDQPSTFVSTFFFISFPFMLFYKTFYRALVSILLLVFTPAKISIIVCLVMLFLPLVVRMHRWYFLFIPLYGFFIAWFFDFRSIGLGDTISARLYWTDLLFQGTPPWHLQESCIGDEVSCRIGVYDGFSVKLPLFLFSSIIVWVPKFRAFGIALFVSCLVTIQYGYNLLFAPGVLIILFAMHMSKKNEKVSVI